MFDGPALLAAKSLAYLSGAMITLGGGTKPFDVSLIERRGSCLDQTGHSAVSAQIFGFPAPPVIRSRFRTTTEKLQIHAFNLCKVAGKFVVSDSSLRHSTEPLDIVEDIRYAAGVRELVKIYPDLTEKDDVIQMRWSVDPEVAPLIVIGSETELKPTADIDTIDTVFAGMSGLMAYINTVNRVAADIVGAKPDINADFLTPRI
jgi:hypothetical protein